MRKDLVAFRLGRQERFDLPDAPRPSEDTPAPVRIVAEYDNPLIEYKDRSRVVDAWHKSAVFLDGLRIAGTILLDGTWALAGGASIERKRLRYSRST